MSFSTLTLFWNRPVMNALTLAGIWFYKCNISYCFVLFFCRELSFLSDYCTWVSTIDYHFVIRPKKDNCWHLHCNIHHLHSHSLEFLQFFRDSFGEGAEGCLLSLQERLASPIEKAAVKGQSSFERSSSASADWPGSSATLVATPSSSSNSSVVFTVNRDPSNQQAKRKNYIIFEHNDEDTLI